MHRILKFEIVDQDAFRTTMRRLYPGYRYKTENEALHQLLTGIQPIPVSQLGCRVRLVEPWEEPVEVLEDELKVPPAPDNEVKLQAKILKLASEGHSLRAISRRLRDEHGIRISHTRVGAIIREESES